jgi:hypothetical protein
MSVRYWKVYQMYRRAVEASLLLEWMQGGSEGMGRRATEYRPWFPDTDDAADAVRNRVKAMKEKQRRNEP